MSELNKDDLDLSKKINKIENLILEIEKKFKKSSILLEEFKKFIEQKIKVFKELRIVNILILWIFSNLFTNLWRFLKDFLIIIL